MEERLDILDENGNETGESATYREAHMQGLIHRSAHVWILNSKNEILVQKRSRSMEAYPGLWHMSAAGHISAGEASVEGARKETCEELGLDLPLSAFKLFGTIRQPLTRLSPTFINNEFCDLYVVRLNTESPDIKLDPGEVEEVRWITEEEFRKWVGGEGETLVPEYEDYEKFFEYLDNEKNNQ